MSQVPLYDWTYAPIRHLWGYQELITRQAVTTSSSEQRGNKLKSLRPFT